jgi:DNA topoisomerase-1
VADLSLADIADLHDDAERCAEVAGLVYVNGSDLPGITRRRAGKGWAYRDPRSKPLTDAEVKARIASLAIPPAWQQVWICPSPDGHILATGIDEKGRKQYVYHPRWRAMRDLLNFYRTILFAQALPKIRAHVEQQLRRRTLDRERVVAAMIAILDETHIRIGNDVYAEENNSYGLSTLTVDHVHVDGADVRLSFPGKSGHEWDETFRSRRIAGVLQDLLDAPGVRESKRVFAVDGDPVDSADINATLLGVTGEHITAKDFRTWGGTLVAFEYLSDRLESSRPAKKITIEAIDEAAEELGNTRAVARSHYVHPHVLETFTENTFEQYLEQSAPLYDASPSEYLDDSERKLLAFLQTLFEKEFALLEQKEA